MIRHLLLAASALAVMAASPAAAEVVAITNARILSMGPAGEIPSGTVVIRDGRIEAVGAGIRAPQGARIIDGAGKTVTPGIVATDTDFGVAEVNSVNGTNDGAASTPSLSAAFDVSYGLDPASFVIPVARLGGVTRAIVTPAYGDGSTGRDVLFAGQAAAVHLGQGTDMLMRPGVGMVLDLGANGAARAGGARGSELVLVRAALEDVRWYMRNKAGYDRGDARQLGLSRADLESLIPVVEGRMPLIVLVHRAADIRQVLPLAREEKLKIILDGAEEAWMVAPEIAAARVPVILNPLSNLPGDFETRAASMENAARLNAAGVMLAFQGNGGGHRARETRYNAGNAVAHGLPYEAAIKAITIWPAKIFGLDGAIGSLEAGKDADVVVWDGDPLEPMSRPQAIFIKDGAESRVSVDVGRLPNFAKSKSLV